VKTVFVNILWLTKNWAQVTEVQCTIKCVTVLHPVRMASFFLFLSFFPYGTGSRSCLVPRRLNGPSARSLDNIHYIKGIAKTP